MTSKTQSKQITSQWEARLRSMFRAKFGLLGRTHVDYADLMFSTEYSVNDGKSSGTWSSCINTLFKIRKWICFLSWFTTSLSVRHDLFKDRRFVSSLEHRVILIKTRLVTVIMNTILWVKQTGKSNMACPLMVSEQVFDQLWVLLKT